MTSKTFLTLFRQHFRPVLAILVSRRTCVPSNLPRFLHLIFSFNWSVYFLIFLRCLQYRDCVLSSYRTICDLGSPWRKNCWHLKIVYKVGQLLKRNFGSSFRSVDSLVKFEEDIEFFVQVKNEWKWLKRSMRKNHTKTKSFPKFQTSWYSSQIHKRFCHFNIAQIHIWQKYWTFLGYYKRILIQLSITRCQYKDVEANQSFWEIDRLNFNLLKTNYRSAQVLPWCRRFVHCFCYCCEWNHNALMPQYICEAC